MPGNSTAYPVILIFLFSQGLVTQFTTEHNSVGLRISILPLLLVFLRKKCCFIPAQFFCCPAALFSEVSEPAHGSSSPLWQIAFFESQACQAVRLRHLKWGMIDKLCSGMIDKLCHEITSYWGIALWYINSHEITTVQAFLPENSLQNFKSTPDWKLHRFDCNPVLSSDGFCITIWKLTQKITGFL